MIVLLYPKLPDFRNVPTLRPFVHVVVAKCRWTYVASVEWHWQGKTEVLGERSVPMPLCPNTYLRIEWPGSNPSRRGKRPAPNQLKRKVKYSSLQCCTIPERPLLHRRFPCCVRLSFGWEQHVDVDERPEFDPRLSVWDLWWEQSATGTGFFFVLRFPPVLIMPPVLRTKPLNLTPIIFTGAGRTAY